MINCGLNLGLTRWLALGFIVLVFLILTGVL